VTGYTKLDIEDQNGPLPKAADMAKPSAGRPRSLRFWGMRGRGLRWVGPSGRRVGAVCLLGSAMAVLLLARPPAARGEADPCGLTGLRSVRVAVNLDIRKLAFDDWAIRSTSRVELPRDWPLADRLFAAEQTEPYRAAMRCLFGAIDADQRHQPPVVTASQTGFMVTDVVHYILAEGSPSRLGFWQLEAGPDTWRLALRPEALSNSKWSSITVSSELPVTVTGPPPLTTAPATAFIWRPRAAAGAPLVTVSVAATPALRLAGWAGSGQHWILSALTAGVGDVVVYVLIVPAAWRWRRSAGKQSGPGRAAGWLLTSILLVLAAHVLVGIPVVAASILPADRFAIDESVGWIALLSLLAVVVWRPRLGRTARAGLLAGFASVVGAAGFIAHAGQAAVSMEVAWRPGGGLPGPAVTPIVLGVIAGVLMLAGYAGIVVRIWAAAGWPAPSASRAVGIVLVGLGFLLAAVSPVQYMQYLMRSMNTVRWLADWDFPLGTAFAYTRDAIDLAAVPLWYLVGLALVGLLRYHSNAGPLPAPVRRLAVFGFVLFTVEWPEQYLGFYLPLTAFVVFFAAVGMLHFAAARGAATYGPARGTIVRETIRHRRLEWQSKGLDTRLTSGAITSEAYAAERGKIEAELAAARSAAGFGVGVTAAPLDILLARGPADSPWQNGWLAAKCALLPGVLATAYLLHAGWRQDGWRTTLDGWFGPAQLVVLNPASELLFWLGGAFVLGFLWQSLPSSRGYIKPLPLIAAWALGVGIQHLLLGLIGQAQPDGDVTRLLLMLVVFTVVGVLVDGRTLQSVRDSWFGRMAPLLVVYRLDNISATAAFLIAQAAAIFALWQQLRSGLSIPPSTVPPPAPTDRTGGG
jgi:hypothetical protein